MKITKSQLKQIIKEEMEQVTQEQERKRLDEGAEVYVLIDAMQQFVDFYQQHPEISKAAYTTAIASLGAGAAGGVVGFLAALQQRVERLQKNKDAAEEYKTKKKEGSEEYQAAKAEVDALGNVDSQQPSTKPRRQQQVKRPPQQLAKER